MYQSFIYPEIVGTLADTSFIILPDLKEKICFYNKQPRDRQTAISKVDWNLLLVKEDQRCLVTMDIDWIDGDVNIVEFEADLWEHFNHFMKHNQVLIMSDRALIEEKYLSPKVEEASLVISGVAWGLRQLALKAANMPRDTYFESLLNYLCVVLNFTEEYLT